jgi:hypothetical protein
MFRFILPFILPFATAQNLGTYLSPCPASAPIAVIQPTIINGFNLGTDAQCLVAAPTGDEGWEVCPAPGVFDAFFTDTEVWFRCAETLSETCNGGCPDQELCISTQIPSAEDEAFFFCGVPCAGGFYLCDDTGKLHVLLSLVHFFPLFPLRSLTDFAPRADHPPIPTPLLAPYSDEIPQPIIHGIL